MLIPVRNLPAVLAEKALDEITGIRNQQAMTLGKTGCLTWQAVHHTDEQTVPTSSLGVLPGGCWLCADVWCEALLAPVGLRAPPQHK